MSARPEAPKPQLSPKAAELGGLSAMRQTMSDFSLDSLSSLLDDELSLDAPAMPAAQSVAPSPPPVPTQPAPFPIALTTAPAAPTELVSVNAARLASLTQPPASVRKSALEETQLYKSTPQPTIDLSVVRRSASEPTQAFSGQLFDRIDATATIPAVVDPNKSSVPETTFWSAADREAADLATVTQPAAPAPSTPAHAFRTPAEGSFTQPIVDAASAFAPAPALAGFFESQPRRTTDTKWEQAVESDRQFTTMLLSDMDEVPWRAELPKAAAENPPFSANGEERQADVVAAAKAQATTPSPFESPSLVSVLDVLEVVAVEQAPSQPTSEPQRSLAPKDSPAETKSNPTAKFCEPTPELRQLATFLLERFTPGVSTVVALIGCETTRPGAEASLALAAAVADATGVSTLIVDGDFANRDISCAVDFAAASGFAEALSQPAKGRSYAQSVGRENLSLLPAGNAMPESSEAASRVAAWIAKAKQEYGLILVWLGTGESDFARRLYSAADATLLLAAIDSDRPSRIEATSERLRSSNARTLGVALVR